MLVGIVRLILWTSKGKIGRLKLTKVEERTLVEIVVVVACTIRIMKMKEHLLLYTELSILCIEDRAVVDRDV